jgi:hypothetical protein
MVDSVVRMSLCAGNGNSFLGKNVPMTSDTQFLSLKTSLSDFPKKNVAVK